MSEAFILRRNNIRATGVQEDHLTVIGFFRRFCQNEIPDELSQACSNYGMFTRMYKFHYADRRRGCKFNELLLWGHVRTVLVICLEITAIIDGNREILNQLTPGPMLSLRASVESNTESVSDSVIDGDGQGNEDDDNDDVHSYDDDDNSDDYEADNDWKDDDESEEGLDMEDDTVMDENELEGIGNTMTERAEIDNEKLEIQLSKLEYWTERAVEHVYSMCGDEPTGYEMDMEWI